MPTKIGWVASSAGAAVLTVAAWAAFLVHPALGWASAVPSRLIAALATSWFLLNVFAWMVPAWRTHIVTTRGPLLGFGFAFAGAAVSAVVDALAAGDGAGAKLFLWRFAVLSLPFVFPLTRRLRPYPHRVDLLVAAFAWLLPLVPGFGGAWFTLDAAPGLLGLAAGGGGVVIGPGRLLGLAMLTTYFYGARAWTAAPLDWMLRRGDGASALRMAAAAAAGGILAHAGAELLGLQPPGPSVILPAGAGLWAFVLAGMTLAPTVEELTFRGILQSGLGKVLPKEFTKRRVSGLAIALLVACVHAWAGSFGMSPGAAIGLSLGLSLAYPRANRLLPAIMGHAGAWALLAVAARLLE